MSLQPKSGVEPREIVQVGHPVLRERALPVDAKLIGSSELDALIEEMIVTMREAPGVGLAAPQIGLPLQLAVVEDRQSTLDEAGEEHVAERERQAVPLTVLINPVIETSGKTIKSFYEGCLSVSGFAAVTPRKSNAKVVALNEKGQEIRLNWSGWSARILQHECDHLQGKLYIDTMDTRTFAMVEYLSGSADEE